MPSIGVSEKGLQDVKKLAKIHKITNGEFVEFSAAFFLKTGLDPKEGTTLKSEIKGLEKRLSQAIAFLQVHEKDYVKPLFIAVEENTQKTKVYLKELNPQKVEVAFDNVMQSNNKVMQSNVLFANEIKELRLHSERMNKLNNLLVELVNLERGGLGGAVKNKERDQWLRNQIDQLNVR